ncbi:MAG: hypothetical protein IKW90_14005 [Lachnospiraceae bacterium]|nr:hypothetical protein [Lachnospiraceae bacterium]
MRFAKKMLAVMLAVITFLGGFNCISISAKELTLAVPKISVKLIENGAAIKISISKTSDAEGYEVYSNWYGEMYDGYREIDHSANRDNVIIKENLENKEYYGLLKTVKKNGTKKRTVIIRSLPSGQYNIAVRSFNQKKYGTLTYSDLSKVKKITIKEKDDKTSFDFSKVKKGDTISFGVYEQNNDFTDGREPIEWIVLSKNKTQLFVVSKYSLDYLPYNLHWSQVTWENCTLRKWLNEKFYNTAFSEEERKLIKLSTVENYDNALYATPAGNDTKDYIFLLSQLDMKKSDYGFSEDYDVSDNARKCVATEYAISQGLTVTFYNPKDKETGYSWWLRTPGNDIERAVIVGGVGTVNSFGARVHSNGLSYAGSGSTDRYAVRPAMIIKIDK